MHKYIFRIQILLFFLINTVISQNLNLKKEIESKDSLITINQQYKNDITLYFEAGMCLSKFQNINSKYGYGYSAGITIAHKLTKSIAFNYSVILSKQNILYKNHVSSWRDDNYVYRQFFDVNISVLFVELPVMINYKFWNTSSSSFYVSFGVGYSISIRNDYRKSNFRNTNEVLGTVFEIPIPENDKFIDDSIFDNSGYNINTGIQFKYKKIFLRFLYINKRYKLRYIDKEHTFLFNFGYQLR
ncbi:hypothetical protein ACX8XN_05545 [Calditrichota bacterium GD2]